VEPDDEVEDGEGDEQLDPFEKRLRRLRKEREAKEGKPAKRRGLPTPIGFRIGTARRALGTARMPLPKGQRVNSKSKRVKDVGVVHVARMPLGLPVGRHVLTVIVWDPAKPAGARRPWVLKDDRGLLEDRWSWEIEVVETPAPK
jgi:hypothetical protein